MLLSSSCITKMLWELNRWIFIFGRRFEPITRYLYYPMSEYVALSILGMKAGFTVAAASRLNTENSSEFYYWNEFNQTRFTFKYVWNAGVIICHHGFPWCSYLNDLKIHFEYQIQKCMVLNGECSWLGGSTPFLEWSQGASALVG